MLCDCAWCRASVVLLLVWMFLFLFELLGSKTIK